MADIRLRPCGSLPKVFHKKLHPTPTHQTRYNALKPPLVTLGLHFLQETYNKNKKTLQTDFVLFFFSSSLFICLNTEVTDGSFWSSWWATDRGWKCISPTLRVCTVIDQWFDSRQHVQETEPNYSCCGVCVCVWLPVLSVVHLQFR